jgi:hypothetical protein
MSSQCRRRTQIKQSQLFIIKGPGIRGFNNPAACFSQDEPSKSNYFVGVVTCFFLFFIKLNTTESICFLL